MWWANALPCAGLLGEVASLDVDISIALEEEALLIGGGDFGWLVVGSISLVS